MFQPIYTITDHLLANIKKINSLIHKLNDKRLPNVVLLELERSAREISAYASTSIEGNPLPLTEVKKILRNKPIFIRDTEKEVLNYNQALQDLNEKIKKSKIRLSLDLILDIQRQVTQTLLPAFDSGYLRQKGVVVNDPRTRQVIFLPPDLKDVKSLIGDLIDFVNSNRDKIDPLILAGIFHKQMVIIHPFIDGNGRTTRLAVKVLLAEMGLNTFNLFSFENYYNQNVTKYFQMVGESGNYYELKSKVDFTNWLIYFTEGIIDELLRVEKLLPKTNVKSTPENTLKSHQIKIINFIKEKGFIVDEDYAKLTNRANSTRALDFKKLVKMGILESKGKGRATYYVLKGGTD